MKKTLAALLLLSASLGATHIDYPASNDDFPNPERGFSATYIKNPPWPPCSSSAAKPRTSA